MLQFGEARIDPLRLVDRVVVEDVDEGVEFAVEHVEPLKGVARRVLGAGLAAGDGGAERGE